MVAPLVTAAVVSMAMAISSLSNHHQQEQQQGQQQEFDRIFHFVPSDTKFDPSQFPHRPWIDASGGCVKAAIDDLPAAALDLSHWINDNDTSLTGAISATKTTATSTTPDTSNILHDQHTYTSTEMALVLPPSLYPNAVIVTNQCDTNAVLSVFACLYPHTAQPYAPLLKAAAAAGMFGEWHSDEGLVLNACIESLIRSLRNTTDQGNTIEKAAVFQQTLDVLPRLLEEISSGTGDAIPNTATTTGNTDETGEGGLIYQAMGQPALDEALFDYKLLQDGTAVARAGPDSSIVLIREPKSRRPFSYMAIHRHLVEMGLGSTCINRILRYTVVSQSQSSSSSTLDDNEPDDEWATYSYRYEKLGYGLHDRRPIPKMNESDLKDLVDKLNIIYDGEWTENNGPQKHTVGLCHTKLSLIDGLDDTPEEVADVLMDLDSGARQLKTYPSAG